MNPASQIVSTGLPEMSVSGRSGTLPFDQPNNAEDDSLGPQFEEKQTASHGKKKLELARAFGIWRLLLLLVFVWP